MKKSSIFLLAILLSSTFLFVVPASSAATYEITELWSNPMLVYDVAVSTDGQYIVAVNNTAVVFFSRGSSTPLWWYYNNSNIEYFLSVAISADGNQVIVGNNSGYGSIYYFDNCIGRSGLQANNSYDWTSGHFSSGAVERRTLDISANGEFVAVGGTGDNLYYFTNCRSKSGAGVHWDWQCGYGLEVLAVDMTPDGRYVAFGGRDFNTGGFVAFIGNADLRVLGGYNWSCHVDSLVTDIAISNDGYSVAAVTAAITSLHYWANAKSLSGSQINTWNNSNPLFSSIDVDSSGDRVIAGSMFELIDGTLHFWDGAQAMSGNNVTETWTRLHGFDIYDVGIDDEGQVLVATSGLEFDSVGFSTNFFTADGSSIANFTIDDPGFVVSVAGDGNTAAVGTGLRVAFVTSSSTLYVYGIKTTVPVGGFVLPVEAPVYTAMLIIVTIAAGAATVAFAKKRRTT